MLLSLKLRCLQEVCWFLILKGLAQHVSRIFPPAVITAVRTLVECRMRWGTATGLRKPFFSKSSFIRHAGKIGPLRLGLRCGRLSAGHGLTNPIL
eukprot:jgi/Mesvir1/12154/Mv26314-RA.1